MFAAVVIRLADVQVVHPDRYVTQGVRQRFVSKQLPAGRGCLDRNGVELALSLPENPSSPIRSWSRGPGRSTRRRRPSRRS